MLEIDVMRQKIEESEKLVVTGSQTQDTSGLSCQRSATEPRQPDNHQAFTILYMYCTGGTECLSHTSTPGSHSVCAIRTLLGVDRKILSIRKKKNMLSGFLIVNAQSILPHAGKKIDVMRHK